jgi:fructose-1,6-bisphosphatase/inositol monophosphatase family enzyme
LSLDPLLTATAVEAALAAGQIQRSFFRQHLTIDKKGPIDLVTAADVAVEQDFRERIALRFPTHTVLGEEGVATADPPVSAFRWIVDPIDGTTNFAHGIALFCVSIALEIDGEIRLGVVYDPIGDELFTAERGGGARLNGAPIRVSHSQTLIDALLVTGFPYDTEHRARQVRIFGALLERDAWSTAAGISGARLVLRRSRPVRCVLGGAPACVGHRRRRAPGGRGGRPGDGLSRPAARRLPRRDPRVERMGSRSGPTRGPRSGRTRLTATENAR